MSPWGWGCLKVSWWSHQCLSLPRGAGSLPERCWCPVARLGRFHLQLVLAFWRAGVEVEVAVVL